MTETHVESVRPSPGGASAPLAGRGHGRARGYRPSTRRRLVVAGKHLGLVLAGAILLYPVIWLVISSFRPTNEIFREPGLHLSNLSLNNYTSGWDALSRPFSTFLLNSLLIVLGCIVGNLVSCSLAAYAFARIEFRAKGMLFAVMLMSIMLPIHVVIVPQYILFSRLDLVNTFVPLILPKFLATDAFFIFLMVQFIRGIPKELDEAARIDGCGHPRIFLRVILPLMVPALGTAAVFTFIWSWNDFFSQLIYLTKPQLYTVPVALRAYMDSSDATSWGPLLAMCVLSLVPVFLVFLFCQRFLIQGIARSGGK